jgi:phytoene synthase
MSLGSAMQLTNIARDIQTDARLGRVYIPKDYLTETTPEELSTNPELAYGAVSRLLRRADDLYEHGYLLVALARFICHRGRWQGLSAHWS